MKIGYLMQEGVPDIRKKPLSGASNHVISVIQELRRAGHHVRLVVKFDKNIYWSDDTETFTMINLRMDRGLVKMLESGVRKIQYELKLPYANSFESLRFSSACIQVLSKYDVLFERMGWLGYGGALASKIQSIPLVLEVNGDHLDEFASKGLVMSKGQYHLSSSLMKWAARQASHTVATGEGWRRKHLERWEVAPKKVSVIENGSAVVDMLRRENLRSFQPAKAGESLQIVYCGGFETWHGIPVLVRAVQKAVAQGCAMQVILIGSGAEEKNIRNLIQELNLEKHFTFTGHLGMQETAGILAHSDIGVSPYCGRVEFSGLKLLDYKAAGLATIASGREGQPAVLVHGRTGWIVPPCNESALTDAIMALSRDSRLRKEMGQQARIEAEQFHSWSNTAAMIEQLFAGILSEGKKQKGQ